MNNQTNTVGVTPDGESVLEFVLTNDSGVTVRVINLGATITSVEIPDRDGQTANVALGFGDVDGYFKNPPYFGATCGRFANRIANGRFSLDGHDYQLACNDGPNHLHGGTRGFDKALWNAEPIESDESVGVRMSYLSPDGEEGYPGNLDVTVEFHLTAANELRLEYSASTDKATPLNLTNHTYWNLAGVNGESTATVLDHELKLHASQYIPVNESLIPTGLAPVSNTPMDFTAIERIGSRISDVGMGYDHCFVIDGKGQTLNSAALVLDPASGRTMEVLTTEPGVQLYTANFLDGSDDCGGFSKHTGFCLECQHFPDSPNQSDFPNSILRPGDSYRQTTIHRFSVAPVDQR